MLKNSRHTVVRVGMLAFVGAVALTAAYYYGATRAQSVVALPAAISLSGQATTTTTQAALPGPSALTVQGAATTRPIVTTRAPMTTTPRATSRTTGTIAPDTTRSTSPPPTPPATTKAATTESTLPPSSATRQVVTPIRGWDCDTNRGPGSAGERGTTYRDCW